jgi:hypothetical protein
MQAAQASATMELFTTRADFQGIPWDSGQRLTSLG